MSKIKLDANQRMYVVINGGVYRPEITLTENPIPQRGWRKGVETKFASAQLVKVKNVTQSPFCKVIGDDGTTEWWACHGHDVRNPEKCFVSPSDGVGLAPGTASASPTH